MLLNESGDKRGTEAVHLFTTSESCFPVFILSFLSYFLRGGLQTSYIRFMVLGIDILS